MKKTQDLNLEQYISITSPEDAFAIYFSNIAKNSIRFHFMLPNCVKLRIICQK